ncbi:MAG: hypothetical protein ACYTKD_31380, partial [Planctomycetota bacterium]
MPPIQIRNLYRQDGVLVALGEDGDEFEVGPAERSFYARPHDALEAVPYEDAPGGWLRCSVEFKAAELRDTWERWKAKGVEPMELDVRPVDRALADLDLRVSGKLSYAMVDLETAEPPIEALRRREYRRFKILAFGYRTSDRKRGAVFAEDESDDAERELLRKLGTVFERYDVVLAWNGGREWGDGRHREDGFDFPVIRARSEALGVKPIDWWKAMAIDQMALYQRRFLSTTDGGQRASFALDAVAKANGIEGKISLKAALRERGIDLGKKGIGTTVAFREAPELLREYVLRDVDLMWEIEKKSGFVAQHLALCRLVNMLPRSDSLTPTRTMDALLLRIGYRSGHHWPTRMK